MSGLSVAGSVASIVSLALTAFVAVQVRALHSYYRRHLVLPNLIRALVRHAKNAETALREKNTDSLREPLHRCDVVLERMIKHADTKLAERIREARKSIAESVGGGQRDLFTRCGEAVERIRASIESAKAFTEEDRWTSPT